MKSRVRIFIRTFSFVKFHRAGKPELRFEIKHRRFLPSNVHSPVLWIINFGRMGDEFMSDKVTCLGKCGKSKKYTTGNFYSNSNPLFITEKLEVCKDCIVNFLGDKDSHGHLDRVYLVLALLNKPFILSKWEECNGEWSKYIPQISSLHQHKNQSFKDSDFGIQKVNITKITQDSTSLVDEEDSEEMQFLIQFWGNGFNPEELYFLQNEYDKLINFYECDSYAMEMIFQEVSHLRLSIKKLREQNKPVDKELKTLQDLLGSANIKPVQETGANSIEQATFGTLIKKYENERPIPEPDPVWKDVDNIIYYVRVWFLGHLCKMLGISNDYSRLYEEEMEKYKVEIPEYEGEDEFEEVDE